MPIRVFIFLPFLSRKGKKERQGCGAFLVPHSPPSLLLVHFKKRKGREWWALPLTSLSPSVSLQGKKERGWKERGGMLPLPSLSPSFPCQGKEGKIGGRVLNKMGLINASLITINSNVHLEINTNIDK